KALDRKRQDYRRELQDLSRDAFGVIADAFEFEVDSHGGVCETQRAGHRLLANEEFQTESVQLLFQLVDMLVSENDRKRKRAVFCLQCFQTVAQRPVRATGHFTDLA